MEILTHPNPVLKQSASPVDPNTDHDLTDLIDSMASTLYEAPGIGLAAPQIGVLKRVVVYDLEDGLVVLCNPRIVSSSEERILDEEACLSVPGISLMVERAARVVCEAQDMSGQNLTIEAEGLHARLLQHEIDHLDGVLLIDRATPEERKAALRRYVEANENLR